MAKASSSRSLESSQRGDSGTNQMNVSCSKDGVAWTRDGMRHDHSSGREKVPSVTPAAMMAPAYQDSLNSPFRMPASRGYASSAISCDAPEMQKGIPMPRSRRDTRNMATVARAHRLSKRQRRGERMAAGA